MPLFSRGSESKKLAETVSSLPARVADWTPEQRQQHNEQSDRAMREQAGISPDAR
ncbi:hypothetical protein ACSCBZ_42500 [Streptomyces niveiscabiei]|uniref:hypothetical protein n=1 Tax=Streptomyces niveiscabiei TaxID=164115 RepID=UPI003EC0FA13